MKLIFIKQGVTSYGPIENSIHRAAKQIPDLTFKIISLSDIFFAQPDPLNKESYAVRMQHAIHDLLQPILQNEIENILLLNGFVLDHYYPEFFDKLRAANKKIIGWQIDDPYYKDSFGHAWDKNSKQIIAQSPCERTFCIAGCGSFQLIDDARQDLAKAFENGKELVTFTDAEDLAGKIDYYLKHEEERIAIAQAGQKRAHSTHTYEHRLREILSHL